MLVGIPASGKSSWAIKLLDVSERKACYISSDEIRETVFGNVADMSHNEEVFQIMKHTMVKALENNNDVILDATFITAKERAPLIDAATQYGAEMIAYYIRTDIPSALRRNARRDRKVPEEIIRRRLEELEEPRQEEGFSRVVVVDNTR